MSLVLGYANKDKAIIMSDGRAGGTVNPSETYDKTRKINDNIILGFVGYKETCEHFLKCVNMDMGNKIDKCYMDDFLKEIKFGMWLPTTKKKLKSTFMIIGKSENGDMKSAIVGESTDYKIKYIPLNGVSFIGGTVPIEDIREICKRNSDNIASPFELLKKIIEDVSDIDESVNKNIFYRVI